MVKLPIFKDQRDILYLLHSLPPLILPYIDTDLRSILWLIQLLSTFLLTIEIHVLRNGLTHLRWDTRVGQLGPFLVLSEDFVRLPSN